MLSVAYLTLRYTTDASGKAVWHVSHFCLLAAALLPRQVLKATTVFPQQGIELLKHDAVSVATSVTGLCIYTRKHDTTINWSLHILGLGIPVVYISYLTGNLH